MSPFPLDPNRDPYGVWTVGSQRALYCPCQHTPHRLRRLPLGCAGDAGVGIQKVKRGYQTKYWSGTPSLLYLKYAQVVPNWVSKPKD